MRNDRFLRRPSFLLLTVGGIGCIPGAPGTWGSAAGALLFLGIEPLLPISVAMRVLIIGLILLALTIIGILCLRQLGSRGPAIDNGRYVLDEVVGAGIAILPALLVNNPSWIAIGGGFVLFRIVDIYKPLGIRKIDQQHTAPSVFLDDIAAGLFVLPMTWLLLLFL